MLVVDFPSRSLALFALSNWTVYTCFPLDEWVLSVIKELFGYCQGIIATIVPIGVLGHAGWFCGL